MQVTSTEPMSLSVSMDAGHNTVTAIHRTHNGALRKHTPRWSQEEIESVAKRFHTLVQNNVLRDRIDIAFEAQGVILPARRRIYDAITHGGVNQANRAVGRSILDTIKRWEERQLEEPTQPSLLSETTSQMDYRVIQQLVQVAVQSAVAPILQELANLQTELKNKTLNAHHKDEDWIQ